MAAGDFAARTVGWSSPGMLDSAPGDDAGAAAQRPGARSPTCRVIAAHSFGPAARRRRGQVHAALELVTGLGADHVIDYTAADPRSGPARYDLILQLGGTYSPALRRVLAPRGSLIQSYGDGNRWLGPIGGVVSGVLLNMVIKQRITSFVAREDAESLEEVCDLIEAGHLRPVIDSEYPLEQTAEALALVKNGRPAGKVVVTVAG